MATTPIPKRQQTERTALQLQWKAAVRSLQLAVAMAERAGIADVEAELDQLIDLVEQAAKLP